jgi:hypothetical protein
MELGDHAICHDIASEVLSLRRFVRFVRSFALALFGREKRNPFFVTDKTSNHLAPTSHPPPLLPLEADNPSCLALGPHGEPARGRI